MQAGLLNKMLHMGRAGDGLLAGFLGLRLRWCFCWQMNELVLLPRYSADSS